MHFIQIKNKEKQFLCNIENKIRKIKRKKGFVKNIEQKYFVLYKDNNTFYSFLSF